jgi:hypothetical protein
LKLGHLPPQTGRVEKQLHIERRDSRIRFSGGARDLRGYASNCG